MKLKNYPSAKQNCSPTLHSLLKASLMLLSCVLLSFSSFATNWYTLTSGSGDATIPGNWTDDPGGAAGAVPGSFSNPGDTWNVTNYMFTSGLWIIGGNLTIANNTFDLNDDISIMGNVVCNGNAIFEGVSNSDVNISIGGNLTMLDQSTFNNGPAFDHIIFVNTLSTYASPQKITWTSTGSSIWAEISVNSGVYVKLMSNVTLPVNGDAPEVVEGTLICGNFVLDCQNNSFGVLPGATIHTANAGGIDSSVRSTNLLYYDPGANFYFNGTAHQVTGVLMPNTISAPGSVSVANAAGVTLSNATTMGSGASLNLVNGLLTTSAGLTLSAATLVQRDNGTISGTPLYTGSIDLVYTDLGNNAVSVTTGLELPTGTTNLNSLTINKNLSGGTVILGSSASPYVNAALTLSAGSLSAAGSNNSMTLYGDWINNSSATAFVPGTGTATFSGSAVQNIGGSFGSTFKNLVLNNSNGVVLGNNESVNGTLTLTSGTITLGSNNLTLGTSAAAVAGSFSSSKMIVADGAGQLRKAFSSGNLYLFPVGDMAGNYTPITLNVSASSYASGAYVGVNITAAKEPNNANVNNYLNRYWSITTPGLNSPSYTVTGATYVPGDVTGTESSMSCGQYGGTLPWKKYGAANSATHTLVSSAITSANSDITGITTAAPTVSVAGGASYCLGGSAVLSLGTSTGDPSLSYSWAPATGLSATVGTSVTASPTVTTTYTLTATDGNGFKATSTAVVTVNPLPLIYTVSGGGTFCAGGSGFHVGLSGSQSGVNYQLYRSGTATGTPVAGTGSALDFGYQTIGGTYTVVATTSWTCVNNMSGSATINVNPVPAAFSVTGGGSYCSGGSGFHVGLSGSQSGVNYQLYRGTTLVGAVVAGTGAALDFGVQTTSGTYTVVATYPGTACAATMTGNAIIGIYALPTPYPVTGGGIYCSGSGGLHVGVGSSAVGISYQLYLGTTPVGSPLAGTGTSLDFGLQTAAGVYKVVATNTATSCTNNMSNTVTITVNPLPNAFTVSGGGLSCAGGVPFHILVSGSNVSVTYYLYKNGVSIGSIAGTGYPLDYGAFTALGTYTVVAQSSITGCSLTMTGSAVIGLYPAITTFNVGGSGVLCPGGPYHVTLSGSVAGINYQLYKGGSPFSPTLIIAGTGAALDFGAYSSAGNYTVVGIGPGGCTQLMTGTAAITSNPLPTAFMVTGGGNYCTGGPGLHIGLGNSQVGVNYQLYLAGAPVGSGVAGTNGVLDFGAFTTAGVYKVYANYAGVSCLAQMLDSAIITVTPSPNLFAVTGGGSVCSGLTTVNVGLSGSDPTGGNVTYYLYRNGVSIGSQPGVNAPLNFGAFNTAGTYTVIALSTLTGCTRNMTGTAVVTVVAAPVAGTITGASTVATGSTIPLSDLTGGGTWSASNAHVTVSGAGVVTGVSAGVAYISYTVSNGVCAVSATHAVTETGPAPPPAAGSISGNTNICVGSGSVLTSTVKGGTWQSGDVSVATIDASNGNILGIAQGIAPITYTVNSAGGKSSVFTPVIVSNTPDAVSISAIPGTTFSAGESVSFTASIGNGAAGGKYQWLVNNVAVDGAVGSSFDNAHLRNNDVVSCLVYNNCGDPVSASVTMKLAVTGAGQTTLNTGIGDVVVAPNPNRGSFSIQASLQPQAGSSVLLQMTDLLGQEVYNKQIAAANGQLNESIQLGSTVANGMYLLHINYGTDHRIIHVVVSQ